MPALWTPAPDLVLVGCGRSKLKHAAPACDLYISNPFKCTLAFARTFGVPVAIASAKYGLLELDQVVEPYELRLSDLTMMGQHLWAERVGEAAAKRAEVALLLMGNEYSTPLKKALGWRGVRVYTPFAKLNLVRRMQWLKEQR